MKTTNLQNTELLKISVDDLDSDAPKPAGEINILREKTFNKELDTLVTKIFDNERGFRTDEPEKIIDADEKNRILEEFEKLIYSLKHVDESSRLTSLYNPFELDVDVFDDIEDTEDYLTAGINQAGFNAYATLKYDLRDCAFITDFGIMDANLKNSLFFGLKDPQLDDLTESASGLVLTWQQIQADPFLKKKFTSPGNEANPEKNFYINRAIHICREFFLSGYDKKMSRFEEFISPLIVIEVNSSTTPDPGTVFELLKKYLSVPLILYLFNSRINTGISEFTYEESLLIIDLFIKSSDHSDFVFFVLHMKTFSSIENLFILKYLLSKIRSRLENDHLIIRVTGDKVILGLDIRETDKVMNIISGINIQNNDMFTLKQIEYTGSEYRKEIIRLF